MAKSHTYKSKPSQQVANNIQVAARSCVPTPIVLEILDDKDKQLTAKVKQQQAKLKKATDALEYAQESKRKAAEEAAKHKHEKKATHEMDEMACLERMWKRHDHDIHHGPCMSVGWLLSIASVTDDAQGIQKRKAVVDTLSIDHERSAFGW